MKKVTLALRTEDGELVESPSAEFTAADMEILKQFTQMVSRVRDSTLLIRGMPAIGNIKWEAGLGMTLSCESYSNAELHELLHVLRPLILQKEAASFHKVSSLIGQRFSNKNVTEHLRLNRRVYDHGELSLYMQISLNDQKLFHSNTLETWLNGEQYHTDQEKAAAWRAFEDSLTEENTRALVISQLQSKVKAIFGLEYIVDLITKDESQ
jgi:hypothetical protein